MSRPDDPIGRTTLPTGGDRVRRALSPREESSRFGECADRGRANDPRRSDPSTATPGWTAQLLQTRIVINRSVRRPNDGTERHGTDVAEDGTQVEDFRGDELAATEDQQLSRQAARPFACLPDLGEVGGQVGVVLV